MRSTLKRIRRHPLAVRIVGAMRARGISGGSFGHSVLVMFFGTLIGQLGSVILSPALTRLYTPEAFGVLGSFTAVLLIASTVAALRYEMALPLARDLREAMNMLAVCGVALAGTTILFILVLLLLSRWGLNVTDFGQLRDYWFLLPFGFLCIGGYQIMVYFATQRSAFQAIARTKIYQGYSGPGLQVVMGMLHFGAWGLLVGFIVGQSTGIGFLLSRLVLQSGEAKRLVSLRDMKVLARRYVRFPLLSSWAGLINTAGTSALVLVAMPVLYSTAVAGFIFLIDRVIGRPMLMVSTSILQVYVGDVSRSRSDPAAMKQRFLRTAAIQLAVVSGWLVLVNLVAPRLFPIAFGEEWRAAVPYLQVMSLALLPQMVMHPLLHTLQILERQGLSALWESARLVAVAAALWGSAALGLDALHALLSYSAVQAVAQIILFFLMLHSIQAHQKDPNLA